MDDRNREEQNVLGRRFGFGSLMRYAAPTMCMMVFMGLYTSVDTVFISRFAGTDALSALNICTPVIYTIVGLAGMLAAGAGAIVGRKMGAGDSAGARQTFSFIAVCGVVLAGVIAGVGLPLHNQMIDGLGASELLMPYCRDYLILQLVFAPANMLAVLFQNFFVTAGRPMLGLGLSIAGGLLNVLLDYVFMVPLQMGVMGASLGTGIGYMVPAVGGLVFFFRSRGTLYFARPKFAIRELTESAANGASELVAQVSTAITTFLFNRVMMRIAGEDGVAAVTVMIYTQFLLTTLFIGYSMGVAPIFSYNYGGKNTVQLRQLFRMSVTFIVVASVAAFVLCMLCGQTIAKIYAQPGSAVYEMARSGFDIFSFSFLFVGSNIFASAMFTALSNGKVSAAISFLRTFGFITVLLLILPVWMGVQGVWLAVPLAELCAFVVALACIFANRKRYGY